MKKYFNVFMVTYACFHPSTLTSIISVCFRVAFTLLLQIFYICLRLVLVLTAYVSRSSEVFSFISLSKPLQPQKVGSWGARMKNTNFP